MIDRKTTLSLQSINHIHYLFNWCHFSPVTHRSLCVGLSFKGRFVYRYTKLTQPQAGSGQQGG